MSLERLLPFLAKAMRKRRERLNMSFQALANKTGLSAEYLEFIETGGTNFSMKTLSTIAEAMYMAPSVLIEEAENLAQEAEGLSPAEDRKDTR